MTPSQPAPRKRLSAEQRREMILDTSGELFRLAPYSEVNTQAIADAAETSQALIFHYFGSKAGVYVAWLTSVYEAAGAHVIDAVQALPPNTNRRDILRTGMEAFTAYIAEHPADWLATQRSGDEPAEATHLRLEWHDTLQGYLERLLEPGSERQRFAISGGIGFFEATSFEWADAGFPEEQRWPLIESVLGAVEGALGDWG
ncbi:TetR/AcrR family transcriptional regulator [Corynebacterium pilosum]|uniref:TetR family transcriptional regulator n=1 Tax=Corynebacterium pilosum TaxID=35756 RepID=A0A376CLF6_9CORY|nr:TetR/AcrR family transcriptional regulator [Corynebacterium pilosum]STC69321.1 TetR family transcriptional regulator [Corynebacterium pilosum]